MPVALPEQETKPEQKLEPPCRSILYNDDWHTFEEVIRQLVKATGCTAEEAEAHAWKVHSTGRDVVFQGARQACEKVVLVLREIRLQAEVDGDF
jgi:ATP-dependent Clp protease adapter protein ClpS